MLHLYNAYTCTYTHITIRQLRMVWAMDQGNEVPHSIEKFQACDYRATAVAIESQAELKEEEKEEEEEKDAVSVTYRMNILHTHIACNGFRVIYSK